MRIAVLSDTLFPYRQGGRETLHFQRATRLARRGHAVRLYTMHWWPERERELVRDGVVLRAIAPRLPIYSASGRRSIVQSIVFGLSAIRLLFGPAFDVLDVDQFPLFHLFAARLVCSLRRRPLTATWHEVWDAAYWRSQIGWLGPLGFLLQRAAARQADLVFANSALTATRLNTLLGVDPRRIVILPPSGVETIPNREPLPRTVDCIFVGRLLPHKHVDLLVRAVATLPGVSLLILGTGPERDRLQALAAELGLSDRVSIEAPGTHEAVMERLRAARLLTFPSTREGFGIAVLEANACGVPALVVKHPDNAAVETVRDGDNGIVCELGTAAIAAAVEAFLKDPSRQSAMSKAAQRVASAYSWETYVSRMLGHLQSIVPAALREAA